MSKESLAKNYAKEVANNLIENALEAAYLKGFEAGVESVKNPPMIVIEDGVEYVNLGLPSGTLWSKELLYCNYDSMLCYNDALKYNIPNRDQVKELFSNTRRTPGFIEKGGTSFPCVNLVAKNGNTVSYINTGYKEKPDNREARFWLSEKEYPESANALSASVCCCGGNDYWNERQITFMGFHLALALVKTPDK